VTSDAALLDKVDLIFFGGAMSDGTRTILSHGAGRPRLPERLRRPARR
jgi:hypothetical protein